MNGNDSERAYGGHDYDALDGGEGDHTPVDRSETHPMEVVAQNCKLANKNKYLRTPPAYLACLRVHRKLVAYGQRRKYQWHYGELRRRGLTVQWAVGI